MNVLVDTTVWSLALRRRSPDLNSDESFIVGELSELIREGRVVVIGAVRQEVLSGIREESSYRRLRDQLREFPDLVPSTTDYEQAAQFANVCRASGIATSPVDLLICSVASSRDLSIFTTDKDFERYQSVLPTKLHQVRTHYDDGKS